MELTPKQKELLERAQHRATGRPADGEFGGLAATRGENPTPAPPHAALGGGMTPRQRELLQLGAQRSGVSAESEEDGMGFFEGARNAVARGLSNLRNIPDVAVAEDLPELADYERDRAARAQSGDLPLWERVLTWQVDRRTPEALDQQAAEAATTAATRQRETQELFPMSPRGETAIRNLMGVDSFRGGLDAALEDPLGTISGAAQVAAEQIPTIVASGVARKPFGVPIMGLSTYSQERYGQLVQEAAEAGYDLTDPEQARAAIEDDAFMARQAQRGQTRGQVIGLVDLISAGIASKTPTTLRGVAGNTGIQTGAGAGGEAAGEYADTGTINPGEVILEGLAEGVTAPGDVAALGLRGRGGLDSSGTDLDAQLAAEQAAEDALLAQEAEQQQAAAVDQQQELRDQYAETFMPPKEFEKQRAAQREADVLNPETEIGQAFRAWRREQGIYHPDEYAKAAKKYLEQTVPKDDSEAARQEYLAALDAHVERMVEQGVDPAMARAQAAAEQQAAPAREPAKPKTPTKKEQARADAEQALGPDWEVNNPDLSSMVEDGKSIYSKRKGVQPRFWKRLEELKAERDAAQEGRTTEQQAEAQAAEEGAPAPSESAQATPDVTSAPEQAEEQADPAARRQEVIAKANQELGPAWMAENKDLVDQLGRGDFDGVEQAITKRAVEQEPGPDAEVSAATPESQTPEANVADEQTPAPQQGTDLAAAFAPSALANSELSGNEQKVWNILRDAFANDEQDTVIQPGGQWNATKIAELAGLNSRQAAQTVLTRLKPKIAKASGLDQGQIRERLAETARANRTAEAAPDINAPVSQFDQAELGPDSGVGTVASANQGAREGLAPEDVQYMEQRSKEPDQYENKRQELADRARQQAAQDAVRRSGRKAIALWKTLSTESGANVSMQSLTKADMTDWVNAVDEFESGMSTEAQLAADHREIERNYDATGGITQESIDAEDTAADQGRALESAASTETENTGPPPGEGGRDTTDTGRGEDTGQRGAATDAGAVVEAESTPDTGVVGTQRAAPVVETRQRKKIDKEAFNAAAKGKKPRFSVADVEAEADSVTAQQIRHATKWLLGSSDNARVIVVRAPEDLIGLVLAREIPLSGTQLGRALNAQDPYGFVQPDDNGVAYAYFFSDNLSPGRERGAVMHELGGHIGFDSLDQTVRDEAYAQILDWADASDNSPESALAQRARERVAIAAEKGGLEADSDAALADLTQSETIAYFIEEAVLAGYNPTTPEGGRLQTFLNKLWQAYKAALAKFTGNDNQPLFIEDFLDLARGAAKLDFINGSIRESIGERFSLSPGESAASQRQWGQQNFGGEAVTQFMDNTKAIWKGGTNSVKPMSRFIRDVADSMPSAERWWDALLNAKQTKREMTGIVEEIANRARALAPERRARVNKFLGDSTFYQMWGYDPKLEGKTVTVNPIMKRRFDALTSEEQQIVRDVFAHGETIRNEMNQVAKELGVNKMFSLHSKLDGPYAPLKRFGSNVAVLRSQELIDAEAALEQTPNKINRDKVEKLKGSPDHYMVKFFDTMGAAKKFTNAQQSKYAEAVATKKAPDTGDSLDTNSRTYQKVLAALNAGKGSTIPNESKAAVEALIKDLYFQSLEETSARLSGARRMNRAGYDPDMMRAFVSHGRSQAQLLAQMKHGGEINASLMAAQTEARKGPVAERERLQNTYNIIARKNAELLKPRNGVLDKIQDHVLAFNTAFMLTSSLGYHVTNKLQPVYSVAKIGGDFNAYSASWRHLFAGEKIARRVVDTSFMRQVGTVLTSGLTDLNNKLEIKVENAPAKYQPLLRELQLRDLLDVGIEEDLNLDNRYDTGYSSLNKAGEWYQNTGHRLYQTARFVEAHNRIASAISAFEVAQSRPAALKRMNMTAKEYAIGLIQDTQGDFSAEETPLVMSALPRTATQFRKYQIMTAWLHADAIKRTFAPSTPRHERVAALRTVGYLFATTSFVSGAVGLPAANLALTVFQALFGDEDEPEPKDIERMVREHFSEDPEMATLVARGVPAFFGLDMSTKMSLNDIFQPWDSRFVSPEASYEGFAEFAGQMILGPTAGQGGSLATGVGYLMEGDIYRGVERIVPKGVRSFMESFRFSEEGYKTPSNVVLADPREFGLFDLMSNAMGLPSEKINTLKWTRGQQWELEQWFREENVRIRREYVEAHQNRDTAAKAALRDEYRELQKAKRRVKPFFNNAPHVLRPQSTANLVGAVRDFRRRQREAQRQLGTGG